MLELRQDAVGAGVVDAPEQLVEAGVGIPAATVVAHLRHPWPDGVHRRVDRYRSRRLDLWIGNEFISWQCVVHFATGRAGALSEAARDEDSGRSATHAQRSGAPQSTSVHLCLSSMLSNKI